MAADRARVSYDPSRQWRALIAQQGRVTVEADWNEASAIDSERVRDLTLAVIGTQGTPDGGYVVTAIPAAGSPPAGAPPAGSPTPSGPGDLIIGPGTLFVGGERLNLDAPVAYSAQPDWLDHSTDPRWSPPAVPAGTSYELVYLIASEQEVSAVEDPALTDIALGGPDTMGRQRMLQRFVRWPSPSAIGYQAWDALVATVGAAGLTFDAASMTLGSAATMQVSFTSSSAAGPCQPTASGGYLGAENQMIAVMVTGTNAAGAATLVWGYDNASFLYRVTAAAYDPGSGTTTVTLASAPPDSYHFPVRGQAVELLRDAVALTAADYIASPVGFVSTVTTGFASASMSLSMSGEPPADYLSAATPQLYLRVWQAVTTAPAGQPTPLGDTGIALTLASSTGAFHPGDFWRFAVRPTQPAVVYPDRYLAAPQPPEGPRTLACPIAVLTWENGIPTAVSSIPLFAGLTGQAVSAGCCGVTVGPADVDGGASLQALLGRYATQGPIAVGLQPGTYTLPAPLVIGSQSNGLTLHACQGGVVLQAASAPGAAFASGLIALQDVTSVTIRGLEFSLPLAALTVPTTSFAALPDTLHGVLDAYSAGLEAGIGISVGGSTGLTIADCTFSLASLGTANVFAAGIYATAAMRGTTITGCTFECASPPATVPFYELSTVAGTVQRPSALPPYRLIFGYLQTGNAAAAPGVAQPAPQVLDGAVLERNQFLGVTVPALVMAQLGSLRVDRNMASGGYGGFWLISLTGTAQQASTLAQFPTANTATYPTLSQAGITALADVVLQMASWIGWALPVTPGGSPAPGPSVVLQLDMSGNRVDATLAGADSGAGLVVADVTGDTGSALIHGNRIATRFPSGAAALIAGVGTASVTGNLMANEVQPQQQSGKALYSYSLVLNPAAGPVLTPASTVLGDLAGVPAVAVTGNVFVDPTSLPARPTTIPSPLGDWDVLNTVIGYGLPGQPAVTQVAPATAPAGSTVTITGSGFTGATAVNFGTIAAKFTPVTVTTSTGTTTSDTELQATVPAGSGTVDVTVTTPAGTSPAVPADEFTFLTVTSVSPSSGQPPLTVTLSGSGFAAGAGNTAVSFGGVAGTNVVVAPGGTQLTAQLPAAAAAAGVVGVAVTVAGVTSPAVAAGQFSYLTVTGTIPAAPVVNVAGQVEVTGYGFVAGQSTVILTPTSTVEGGQTWDVVPFEVAPAGTSLMFAVPFTLVSAKGAYQIQVKTPYGLSASPTTVTVTFAGVLLAAFVSWRSWRITVKICVVCANRDSRRPLIVTPGSGRRDHVRHPQDQDHSGRFGGLSDRRRDRGRDGRDTCPRRNRGFPASECRSNRLCSDELV
jgi:hypothetical protein